MGIAGPSRVIVRPSHSQPAAALTPWPPAIPTISSTLVITSPNASGSAISQLCVPGTVTTSGLPNVAHMSSKESRVMIWSR